MASDQERSLIGAIAAYERHSRLTADGRREATSSAREARWQQLLHEADPDGVLPIAEREERARRLLQAHMSRCALLSVQARAARRQAAA